MSNEILTADQYRNHRRIARYLARIGNHYDPSSMPSDPAAACA